MEPENFRQNMKVLELASTRVLIRIFLGLLVGRHCGDPTTEIRWQRRKREMYLYMLWNHYDRSVLWGEMLSLILVGEFCFLKHVIQKYEENLLKWTWQGNLVKGK